MSLREKYGELGLYQKLGIWGAIASILALVVVIFLMVPGEGTLPGGILKQEGRMTQVKDAGVFEVFYPKPYQTTPELTWLTPPSLFQVLEERPDGFVISITAFYAAQPAPKWQAKGVPKRNE